MDENKINDAMDENEEAEVVMLTDEDGNEHAFQLIGEAELKGTKYYAFVPVEDETDDGEFFEYTILKSVVEDGEEMLISIDDDDEFDDAADYFDAFLNEEVDYDEESK